MMRGFLGLAFLTGLAVAVFGAIMLIDLVPRLTTLPAAMVLPQMIVAELLAGFGGLLVAVMAVIDRDYEKRLHGYYGRPDYGW
jgi:hypothetical protein